MPAAAARDERLYFSSSERRLAMPSVADATAFASSVSSSPPSFRYFSPFFGFSLKSRKATSRLFCSLRFASILAAASTAFFTTLEQPLVWSWSTATHSTFEYWDGSSTSQRWTWTAYLVEVIECESGFFARSPL